jgi:hypothetical protein
MTATLALAQPGDTSAADREDPSWHQAWNHVGSGGTNMGLHQGRNPYAEPVEPHGVNNSGADYSGYRMPNR